MAELASMRRPRSGSLGPTILNKWAHDIPKSHRMSTGVGEETAAAIYWLTLRVGSPRYRSGFCTAVARLAAGDRRIVTIDFSVTATAIVRSADYPGMRNRTCKSAN